jgi:hypothetical protein
MGHLKDFQQGTYGDPFNGPVNGTLGATTAATANVTTLTTSSTVTHNGGTANGVAYLNGSKVLTTGSALVFDGTNLGVGVTPSAWNVGKAIEVGSVGNSVWGPSSSQISILQNAYYNGAFKYASTAAARYYQQVSGIHAWYNAASDTAGNAITFTQAMTLFASGALALGTTSDPTSGHFAIGPDSGKTAASLMWMANTGGRLYIGKESSAGGTIIGGTDAYAAVVGTNNAYPLQFGTNNAVRATITSAGYLLVGTTSAPETYATKGAFVHGGSGVALYTYNSSVGADSSFVSKVTSTNCALATWVYSSTTLGSITTNGTVVVYGGTSDYRLKTVIGAVTGQGERIDALEPIEYTWNSNGSHTRGFLAHKFQEVYPDSVTGTKDDIDADGKPVYQGMQASTSEVIADLVAEIQSLRKRLAALESA